MSFTFIIITVHTFYACESRAHYIKTIRVNILMTIVAFNHVCPTQMSENVLLRVDPCFRL